MNLIHTFKNETVSLFKMNGVKLIALIVALLSLLNTSTVMAADALTIATSKSPLSLPIYIAESEGYFSDEGVNVKLLEVIGGHRAFQQLINGDSDLATSSEAVIMFNSFRRSDYAVIASFVSSRNDIKIVVRKEANVDKPEQLIGKRIATVVGAASNYYLDTWLLFHGIDPKLVKIINLQPEQMEAALSKGEIDAVAIWEPFPYSIHNALQGTKILANPGSYELTFNLIVHKKLMGMQDEKLVKVLRAVARAERFIKENPSKAQALMRTRLQLDQAYVDWIWPHNNYRLSLDQSLLSTLESEARWARQEGHVSENAVINYLGFIFPDPLLKVSPKSVGIKK